MFLFFLFKKMKKKEESFQKNIKNKIFFDGIYIKKNEVTAWYLTFLRIFFSLVYWHLNWCLGVLLQMIHRFLSHFISWNWGIACYCVKKCVTGGKKKELRNTAILFPLGRVSQPETDLPLVQMTSCKRDNDV